MQPAIRFVATKNKTISQTENQRKVSQNSSDRGSERARRSHTILRYNSATKSLKQYCHQLNSATVHPYATWTERSHTSTNKPILISDRSRSQAVPIRDKTGSNLRRFVQNLSDSDVHQAEYGKCSDKYFRQEHR